MPSAQATFNRRPSNSPFAEEIRPSSRGIVFSPRPSQNSSRQVLSLRGRRTPRGKFRVPTEASTTSTSTLELLADHNLTSVEIENEIRQKVGENSHAIRQAFEVYDSERCLNVTKGEFRRVLANYCITLTTEQFNSLLSKIPINRNGTIPYIKFLEMFSSTHYPSSSLPSPVNGGGNGKGEPGQKRRESKTDIPKFAIVSAAKDQGIDAIEKHLQKKIAGNLKNVIRGFQLFDYNRDGQIQRHELRRVLDSYCMKMSEHQFDKLWARYDLKHVGTIDYREFLRRLGVNAATGERQLLFQLPPDNDFGDAPWDAKKKRLEREKDVTDLVLKRNRQKTAMKNQKSDEMSISQLEKEFRSKMRTNYVDIERAMRSFDYGSDGFITIEDLKAVLDNFVLPTTSEVFQQLMFKFAVRGTGKVSWEQFLAKFQDPQSDGNGQTLPIGQNHKINPMRLGLHDATAAEVLNKLKNHVLENFTSVKSAFLALDQNRKGVITRKELRRIVEKFAMKLNDENVKELFSVLDPEHTGFINYHNFLNLFEQKESVKAHKWLNSEHKVNHNQPPAIMAWDTVEDLLREKLSENYRQVADEYVAMDTVGKGTITRTQLRRLIDRYALPLSDEHFEKLWNSCEEADNRINFSCFLDNLGIDVKPGDLEGPSTRITNESNATEMQRKEDHQLRMDEIDKTSSQHTFQYPATEVIRKLKIRMSQHDSGIRKTFLKYAKSGSGRVYKKDLRMMLEEMGFILQESQFQDFLKILNYTRKGLTYTDFIGCFEDLRQGGYGEALERAGNHMFNKTIVKYMTAKECYEQIIEKMRQNFSSVRTAFFRCDDDHDGALTMYEFRRLLDSLMFIITDETFLEFLKMLGLHKKSILSYFEFLQKFEVIDKEEGHPWLNSDHRYNTVRKPAEMTADMVHECLCLKAEQAWVDMVRTFRNFDADGNGIITRRDLRSLLFRYTLPLSHDQFQHLWKRYDDERKGFITQADFLHKLGKSLAPGDDLGLQGTSTKIIEENHDRVQQHLDYQKAKHEEIGKNQSMYARHLTAEVVERDLKDRFRQYYADFDKAFRKMDRNRDGYVTLADLQRLLLELNYFLDEEQFMGLLKRLGLSVSRNRISYFDFLRAIDDGRASRFKKRRDDSDIKRKEQVTWNAYEHLPVEKAMAKLKEKVTVNYDSLSSGFRAFDRAQTGLVSVSEFRRLLDNFCFHLSDKQFRAVLAKCKITTWNNDPRKMVNWIVFLQDFSTIQDTKLKEWTDYVGEAAPPQLMQEISLQEIEERLREVVCGRYSAIANAFEFVDYAKIYVVAKNDFRDILHEHVMRLTDDQFEQLWNKMPLNEFNNLEYREFLKKYSIPEVLPKLDANASGDKLGDLQARTPLGYSASAHNVMNKSPHSRPTTADTILTRASTNRGQARFNAPLVNASTVEGKLKNLVFRNWQEIQKQCRRIDTKNTGCILPDEFIEILDKFGLMLDLEEARCIMMKYDVGDRSGMFAYQVFLRNFILNMKPSEEDILKRKKIRVSKIPFSTGNENRGFLDKMISMKQKISSNWKEMRRTFKKCDFQKNGCVTAKTFRNVLRQYTINLSEEDFFNLLTFYDPEMIDKIPYNDFIRAFLK